LTSIAIPPNVTFIHGKDFNNIEENTSGIKSLLKDYSENAPIYDLNGRVLSHPRKGFNIFGGKKVIVK